MGENRQPKHCLKRQTTKSEIHVCRFEKGPNLAVLKSPVNTVSDLYTKNAIVPYR